MTHTTENKEVLHTQGEWKVFGDLSGWQIRTDKGLSLAYIPDQFRSHKENLANAELIVKAVNERQAITEQYYKDQSTIDQLKAERQKLLDSNRELLAALRKAMKYANGIGYGKEGDDDLTFIDNAINNAKKI